MHNAAVADLKDKFNELAPHTDYVRRVYVAAALQHMYSPQLRRWVVEHKNEFAQWRGHDINWEADELPAQEDRARRNIDEYLEMEMSDDAALMEYAFNLLDAETERDIQSEVKLLAQYLVDRWQEQRRYKEYQEEARRALETFDFNNQPQQRALLESAANDESGVVRRYDNEREIIIKQFPDIAEELAQEYEIRRRVLEFDGKNTEPKPIPLGRDSGLK